MGTLTVNATNGQTVAAGASYTVSYPAGKSAADYLATGAKITTSDGSIYSATVSLGGSGITITNPTGRAIASGGFDYLDLDNAGIVARFNSLGEGDVLLGPKNTEASLVSSENNLLTGGLSLSSGGPETLSPDTAKTGRLRIIPIGDSFTAANSGNSTITSLSRANNVVTVALPGHARGTGEICRVYNCLDTSYNANNVAVTRIDANTLTYPSVGPDGTTTNLSGSKNMQLQSLSQQTDTGYLTWLNMKCGGALRLVTNAGCSGQDSADMLARYDTDVVAQAYHDMVIIQTGYNDLTAAGFTAEQMLENVSGMVEKSYGKKVLVIGALPWTTGGTAANRLTALRYNRMVRNYCQLRRNVRFVDAAAYLVDAMNATKFSPLPGMLNADGIHPSAKGGERIAQAIYDVIQYEIPKVSRLTSCNGDNYGADSSSKNVLDAAPWTNSGGALAGGATGTAATGVAVTNTGGGTCVASVVARSDDIGYDQVVVFTPSANNDSCTISGSGYITGRHTDGELVSYVGELSLTGMSGASIKGIDCDINFAGSSGHHYPIKNLSASAATYPATDMTLTLASLMDAVICTGTTSGLGWTVIIKAGAAGTALTIKLGRQSLEKV